MTRHTPFQYDRPTFVRVPFKAAGRMLKIGDEFKWKEQAGLDTDKAHRLYLQGFIHHNDEREGEMQVGDGLERLDVEQLHALVDTINKKVKEKTRTEQEYNRRRCKKSKIVDKQRGLIRSWRRNFGHME